MRDMAREFAREELAPRAAQARPSTGARPRASSTKLGELGMWGLTIPEEFGGPAWATWPWRWSLEEINRGCASTGVTVSVHNSLVCSPILKWGTEEQKKPSGCRSSRLGRAASAATA